MPPIFTHFIAVNIYVINVVWYWTEFFSEESLELFKKELKASEEIILDSPNTTVSPTAK